MAKLGSISRYLKPSNTKRIEGQCVVLIVTPCVVLARSDAHTTIQIQTECYNMYLENDWNNYIPTTKFKVYFNNPSGSHYFLSNVYDYAARNTLLTNNKYK